MLDNLTMFNGICYRCTTYNSMVVLCICLVDNYMPYNFILMHNQ